ncbi:hypothetical protein ACWEVD_17015 [Nocardia thailandica]
MTETDNRRPRRRAARSAGPPVEGDTTIERTAPAVTVAAAPKPAAAAEPAVSLGKPTPRAADDPDTTVAPGEPDDTDEPEAERAASSRSIGRIVLAAAAAVLVLALVAGAGVAGWFAWAGMREDDLREQYTATARQAVINLTTIRAQSAKQDIDRILATASGQFRSEFDGRVDPFTTIVQQAKVDSSGEVVESGIERADDGSAKVLVAVKQTVTNAGSPEPQQRMYRFRVTVTNDNGNLSVTSVEFVG